MGRLTEAFNNYPGRSREYRRKGPVAQSFITQAVPDIKRKLQKLGKGPEIPISDLVEEANGVFLNRDPEEEARKEQKEA